MDKTDEYKKAIGELEKIASIVEDPSTGLDDIDRYLKRTDELVKFCRAYLRDAGQKAHALDE